MRNSKESIAGSLVISVKKRSPIESRGMKVSLKKRRGGNIFAFFIPSLIKNGNASVPPDVCLSKDES